MILSVSTYLDDKAKPTAIASNTFRVNLIMFLLSITTYNIDIVVDCARTPINIGNK